MAEFVSAANLRALDAERSANWDRLLTVREEVLKALEPLRADKTISANLEAHVTLIASGKLSALLREIRRAASRPLYRPAEVRSGGRSSERCGRRLESEGLRPPRGWQEVRALLELFHARR